MIRLGFVLGIAVTTAAGIFSSSPALLQSVATLDVKGWHGAEWGMNPEQVAAAVGFPLGEPLSPDIAKQDLRASEDARAAADFTVIKEYRVAKVPVSDWTAHAEFFFGESGRSGLTKVVLELGSVPYPTVRDEVTAKYGAPTSDSISPVVSAKWIFASTQISLLKALDHVVLLFRRHATL